MKKKILKILLIGILAYPILCVATPGDGTYIDSNSGTVYYIKVLIADIIVTSSAIAYVVWKERRKAPSKNAAVCNAYVIERLKEVGASYAEQMKSITETTAWNVANKIAERWDNIAHYIQVLYASGNIDDEIKTLLEKIGDNFARYSITGEHYDSEIWTPRGMETSSFWAEQRRLAKEALQLMSAKDRQKETAIEK